MSKRERSRHSYHPPRGQAIDLPFRTHPVSDEEIEWARREFRRALGGDSIEEIIARAATRVPFVMDDSYMTSDEMVYAFRHFGYQIAYRPIETLLPEQVDRLLARERD